MESKDAEGSEHEQSCSAIMIQTLMMTCVEYKDQFWCKYEMYYHIV